MNVKSVYMHEHDRPELVGVALPILSVETELACIRTTIASLLSGIQ